MRAFVRHTSDIPIEVQPEDLSINTEERLTNIGAGGLSFCTSVELHKGAHVRIRISLVNPVFEVRGRVVWCRKVGETHHVGIQFVEANDSSRVRMIEQICRIEQYKKEILRKEGRTLSGRDAALEWIGRYAESFHREVFEG